jgi:hypothetical protein
VTLSSNIIWVVVVVLSSNGLTMSMNPLLLWVTDKWAGYKTNREVTAVILSSNGPR